MVTVAEVNAQRQKFLSAYAQGKINKAQYDQAMRFTSEQLRQLQPNQPAPQASSNQGTSSPPSVFAEPGTPQYAVQGSYVQQGSTLTPVTTHDTANPLKKEVAGYVVEPPKPASKPTLEAAEQSFQNYKNLGTSSRGGTAPISPTYEQVASKKAELTANLSVEDKALFEQRQQERVYVPVKNLGLFLGAGVAAPIFGPTTAAVAVGTGLTVSQGFKTGYTYFSGGDVSKSWLTSQEAFEAGTSSVILAGVGGGAIKGAGAAGKALGWGLPSGMKGVAISVAGRAAINSGISGGASFVSSRGDLKATAQGAAFGAAFSLGGDVIVASAKRIPTIKYGNVNVKLEGGEQTNWQGIYLSRNERANILYGKYSSAPENVKVLSHGATGEVEGYRPQSNIEAAITKDIMLKTGTPKQTIEIAEKAVHVTATAKGVKNPKLFDTSLPSETKTLTATETAALKKYFLSNSDKIEKLFGKATAIPQENKAFGLEVKVGKTGETVSSLRTTTDFDVQLKSGLSKAEVEKFTQGALNVLKNPSSKATMKKGSSLIETVPVELRGRPNAKLAHAVDIHSKFDVELNPLQQGTEKAWGIQIAEKPRLIEGLPSAKLTEQVGGKLQSLLGITSEGELGPVAHRMKDIPDWITDTRTLIEQRKNPFVKRTAYSELTAVAKYFGVKDIYELPTSTKETMIEVSLPKSQKAPSSYAVFSGVPSFSSSTVSPKNYVDRLQQKTSKSSRSFFNSKVSRVSPSLSYESKNSFKTSKIQPYPKSSKTSLNSNFPSAIKIKPLTNSLPSLSIKPSLSRSPSIAPYYPAKGDTSKSQPYPTYVYRRSQSLQPKYPTLPALGLGSGEENPKVQPILRGDWRKKNNPVKQFDAMLKTFGIKVPKGSAKTVNRLDKRMQGLNLARKPSRSRGKGRKRRR